MVGLLSMPPRRGSTTVKELFASPIQRLLYAAPNDRFGMKPYSNPTPTVPPQPCRDQAEAATTLILPSRTVEIEGDGETGHGKDALKAAPKVQRSCMYFVDFSQ